jgi:hypothetical protein
MDGVKSPVKPRHPDRIALAESELAKIDAWRVQIVAAQRGVRLSRCDLVRWLIETKPSELTTTESLAVGRRHFDEKRFLLDLTREFNSRKARGEEKILDKLLLDGKVRSPKTPRSDLKVRDDEELSDAHAIAIE